MKRILTLTMGLLLASSILSAAMYKPMPKKINKMRKDDTPFNFGKQAVFSATEGGTFDKSANGYGWYWSNSKRVQVNLDPVTGQMLGSIYRRLDLDSGTGTLGGMAGVWDTDFAGYAQSVYTSSPYTGDGKPGTRFPQTTEFINGYVFGAFTDYDVPGATEAQPMFVVGDATFGYDLSFWSTPKRIEATEGGAVISEAWTAKGDVVYNPDDGYYYWTTWWDADGGSFETSKLTMSMGRTLTPADPDSWVWTDYNDIYLDCSSGSGIDDVTGLMEVAYAKDTQGNGTGYGLVVGGFIDDTYIMTNQAGDTLDVSNTPRLGYMYTTNYGADWSTGDFKSNWQTPNNEGNNMFAADINKLFDWYGQEITGDSIGVDGEGNAIYEMIPLNWPYMTWNTHVVVTEENIAHVIIKVYGATSTENPDGYYQTSDEQIITGYYDVVGRITDSGVNWLSVNYIATWMGWEEDPSTAETFGNSSNTHKFSNGYAGNGVVYATWLDRPESRYVAPNSDLFAAPDSDWLDDGYFSYSPDNGRTWEIEKIIESENIVNPEMPYQFKYAYNVTNTNSLMEEGWTVANHGTNSDGEMTAYAACQYYDQENPIAPPIDSYRDYQQFLKIWKITGTGTGIETEYVSIEKDFVLYQNYPNPFNPETEINFSLKNNSNVKLSVFNTKGETIAELVNCQLDKGFHSIKFDATSFNSGVYFYKINVDGISEAKKMILTK